MIESSIVNCFPPRSICLLLWLDEGVKGSQGGNVSFSALIQSSCFHIFQAFDVGTTFCSLSRDTIVFFPSRRNCRGLSNYKNLQFYRSQSLCERPVYRMSPGSNIGSQFSAKTPKSPTRLPYGPPSFNLEPTMFPVVCSHRQFRTCVLLKP